MRSTLGMALALILAASSLTFAEVPRRLAVVAANGPVARAIPIWAYAELQVTDALTAKLTSQPGLTLIDRATIDKIIQEQNFQNSDRSSSDTAVRIGKLLGAEEIVTVDVYDGGYTTHQEGSGNSLRTIGTQVLRVRTRLLDVESGTILAAPSSEFQDSTLVSEVTKSSGFQWGGIRVPPKQTVNGSDPKVIQSNEWAKACDAVTSDLAAKLKTAMGSALGPNMASALVAGIANGSVYINRGSNPRLSP